MIYGPKEASPVWLAPAPCGAEEELLQELTHPGVDPIGKVRVEPLLVLPQRSVKFLLCSHR